MKTTYIREVLAVYRHPVQYRPEDSMREPRLVANLIRSILPDDTREHFGALFLDCQLTCVGYVIDSGKLDSCNASSRRIFQAALLTNAKSIILFHNHPGGNLVLSKEDLQTTRNFKSPARLLEMQVLDHIVVSSTAYVAMSETAGSDL